MELDKFFKLLREKTIEIAPDYPNVKTVDYFELLWAITSSCQGSRLANEDCHKFINFLVKQLGWTNLEAIEKYEMMQKDNTCDHQR